MTVGSVRFFPEKTRTAVAAVAVLGPLGYWPVFTLLGVVDGVFLGGGSVLVLRTSGEGWRERRERLKRAGRGVILVGLILLRYKCNVAVGQCGLLPCW